MSDSPINLMLYGHTHIFVAALQDKNNDLRQQLCQLMSQLTQKKEENLKCLKDIDNQEEVISQMKSDI
jgi:mannitol/fructose-specific phosphotransferase system IIA component (Ntr-type)